MQAVDTQLQPLIEGTKQYLVPLFQRAYSWEKAQWSTLWEDIHDLTMEDSRKTHFMGAIVTMPAHTNPAGITKYLLIDGQQRLTTLLILLIALRDKATDIAGNLSAKIYEHFLTNKFNEDEDFFKLLPTQLDRVAFINLVESKPITARSKVTDAYSFFAKKIGDASKDELEALFHTVTSRLIFVSIMLAADDNAYLIFEGLNAKGLPLTQADLIRNYLLMRIHRKHQDAVFTDFWLPMQTTLGANLTEFIRHFLMRNASFIKLNEVYATLKSAVEDCSEQQTIEYLETLNRFSVYYQNIIEPESESDVAIKDRLFALKRLDVTTAYPFLLDLFDDRACQRCTDDVFIDVLEMLETFLVRRFVCSVPTHDLNKFFPTVLAQAKQYPSITEGVADILSKRSFPRNAEFKRNFVSLKMYGSGERGIKTKLILERIEESFGHKEEVQMKDLTIEHIMPQTLTDWWKAHLGVNWEHIYERCVHTVGNLTLTGYNPSLSNSSFDEKKAIYSGSHVEMTKRISGEGWTEQEIKNRAEELYERAIIVWPNLGNAADDVTEETENDVADVETAIPVMSPAEAVEVLGGGVAINGSKYCFAINSGVNVVVTCSRLYPKTKPYWYGLSPSFLKAIDSQNCRFVAFGMGNDRVALVPAEIVKTYTQHCGVSKYKTQSIHHYHFFITKAEPHEMYGNQDSPRIVLTDYLVRKTA
jgi:uncharacterized protein with ParB-like and HNH nuclease domain